MNAILQHDKVSNFSKTSPLQQKKIEKLDVRLSSKMEEIERYQQLKVTLLESLSEGLIDKDEYLELKAIYDKKMQDAKLSQLKLQEELEDTLKAKESDNSYWVEQCKSYRNIDKLDRRMVVIFIDKILVYEDCRLQIYFRYEASYDSSVVVDQTAQIKEVV